MEKFAKENYEENNKIKNFILNNNQNMKILDFIFFNFYTLFHLFFLI